MALIAAIRNAIRKVPSYTNSDSADESKDAVRRWGLVVQGNPDDHEAAIEFLNAALHSKDGALIEHTTCVLEKGYSHVVKIQYTLARHYLDTGQIDRALAKWQAIYLENPTSTEALNSLAYVYLKLEDVENALLYTQHLSELPKTEVMVSKLRSRVYCRQEKWGDAIESCLDTLSIGNPDPSEQLFLASTYFKNNQFGEAYEQLDLIAPDGTNNSKLFLMRQQLNMKLNHWEAALLANTELRKISSDSPDAQYDHATILLNLERYDESDKVCRSELERDANNVRIMKLYARIGQARAKLMHAA